MADILLTHSNHLYYDRKQVRKMQPYPPLQTLLAAACLRRAGYQVALFDPTLEAPEAGFEQALARHRPRLVAVCEDNFNFLTKMCLLRNRELACWMARTARAAGVPAIVNGSDASDRAAEYLDAGFSYVLTARWKRPSSKSHACCCRAVAPCRSSAASPSAIRNRARCGKRRAAHPSPIWIRCPMPAWDLIDAAPYRRAWTAAHGYFSLNMVSSRGCPYRCNWCAKPIWGDSYHCRSARLVAEEMLRTQDALPARSPLVRRRYLRALAAVDARVRRRGGSAGRADPVQDAIALRPDDAPDGGRTCAAPAAPRSGWAWSPARRTCSTPWTRARGSGRSTRRARTCAATASAPASFCSSAIRARPGRRSRRPSRWCARRGRTISAFRSPIRCRARVSTSMVSSQLGPKENWSDSDDLDMMFQGAFTSDFYRALADALHLEVREGRAPPKRRGATCWRSRRPARASCPSGPVWISC